MGGCQPPVSGSNPLPPHQIWIVSIGWSARPSHRDDVRLVGRTFTFDVVEGVGSNPTHSERGVNGVTVSTSTLYK